MENLKEQQDAGTSKTDNLTLKSKENMLKEVFGRIFKGNQTICIKGNFFFKILPFQCDLTINIHNRTQENGKIQTDYGNNCTEFAKHG